MRFPGLSRMVTLIGMIAFCAFAGDIVADSISDACGDHCTSQSSSGSDHDKSPCSHCSCAAHNGSLIASTSAELVSAASDNSFLFLTADQSGPPGIRPAIDHPPQLLNA